MVHEEKTLVEKVTAKHTIDMLIVRDPKGETEQSLKVNDYFRATTYLHAVLEYRGKLAIERKLKSEGRNVNSDLIDDLTLKEVAMMTYSMKLSNSHATPQ